MRKLQTFYPSQNLGKGGAMVCVISLTTTVILTVVTLAAAHLSSRKVYSSMTISFDIPTPIFWITTTIIAIILLNALMNLIYPDN